MGLMLALDEKRTITVSKSHPLGIFSFCTPLHGKSSNICWNVSVCKVSSGHFYVKEL